jgi:putative flippase GtrA
MREGSAETAQHDRWRDFLRTRCYGRLMHLPTQTKSLKSVRTFAGNRPNVNPAIKFRRGGSEFLRFLPVGGSAAAISLLIYAMLLAGGLHTAPAKAIGFTAGAAVSFVGNRSFTFRRDAKGRRSVFLFCALYVLSLIINISINEAVLYVLRERSVLSLATGWFVATACSASANFVGMKILVFRGRIRGGARTEAGAQGCR